VQHLVGVGVADARDDVLITEHALDLHAPAIQDGGECGDVEVVRQRLGTEGRDTGDIAGFLDQVNREPFLCSLLGEVEPGAVVEDEPEGQRALSRLDGLVGYLFPPAQPSRARKVEH
jgi:hypothetical protein